MSEKLEQFKALLAEVADLNNAQELLGWDQQTYMPQGAAESRGNQLATLGKISHQKFTSDEIGSLLEDLEKEYEGADPDLDDLCLLKVTRHEYDRATRVPSEFVAEFAVVTSKAFKAWTEARSKSDFSIFEPHLEKVIELNQRYVTFFPPADHPAATSLDSDIGFSRETRP